MTGSTKKAANDKLLTKFEKDHDAIVRYMERIDIAIRAINDNSVLHSKTLEANTDAISSNNRLLRLVTYIMLMLVVALIILAGAEKTFQYLKLPYLP